MNMIPQKTCFYCKEQFPATPEYFYAEKASKDGLSARCKPCRSQKQPRYIPMEGYKRCASCKHEFPATDEYFDRNAYNTSGLCYYCRPCRHTMRQRQEAKDVEKAKARQYRYTQTEKCQISQRRYRTSKNGRDHGIARGHKRRATKRSAGGSYTPQQIQDQHKRQKGKCYYCSEKMKKYHIEHVVPISREGTNDISNIVLSCPHCNRKKSNKLPSEWPEGGRLL